MYDSLPTGISACYACFIPDPPERLERPFLPPTTPISKILIVFYASLILLPFCSIILHHKWLHQVIDICDWHYVDKNIRGGGKFKYHTWGVWPTPWWWEVEAIPDPTNIKDFALGFQKYLLDRVFYHHSLLVGVGVERWAGSGLLVMDEYTYILLVPICTTKGGWGVSLNHLIWNRS